MKRGGRKEISWRDGVDAHDYPAAFEYLSLTYPVHIAEATVENLRRECMRTFKAKDIIRASGLPLLPKTNVHVGTDLRKVKKGASLSPILLVRGRPLIIADGYHRICAVYHFNEDSEVPCKIGDLCAEQT